MRARQQSETERYAQELLTQQVRAEERFLASMSHELRTPLNSIIGFSGVLASGAAGELNDEQKCQLTMIERAGRRMLALVSDVLDLATVRSGQLAPQFALFDVGEACAASIETIRPVAAEKGLTVEMDCSGLGGPVVTDREMLERVLLNLLDNAIKFTASGGVVLRASTGESMVHFDVIDTGPGIPANEIDRLAEEFYQVPRSLDSAKPQGVGLGLAISARLARLLGGAIAVESEVGKGSIVSLVIPKEPSATGA